MGGTGQDHLFGGYGNDLLNADDDLETSGGSNDAPDGPQASYEDMAYGGAGRDVLIANTGGDRLIDWAGEFNSYIVPFAPFGLATVSRALQPGIMAYLYALSASDGADPTRAADTGADPARNGEPEGELGLVKQQDPDWHDQTGAPDDPQPGNIPGGARDVLRGADFNNSQPQGFFIDSGVWQVSSGRMQVSPSTLGGDAASVFYVDTVLPSYFEFKATINAAKPTGGSKSNAYMIFDYQNPTDFKFAGVNISTNKMEMGYRDLTGWHVVEQTPAQLKPDQDYNLLLALNGVTATLVVNNSQVFSYAFAPRVIDGFSYGLNNGMVGLGANNATARIDNVVVQVLPPEITLEETEDFADGLAERLVVESGTWQLNGARYEGTPAGDRGISLIDLGQSLTSTSILEVAATLRIDDMGGVVFDYYGPSDFKFAALSAATDEVIIGHYSRHGWAIDAVASTAIDTATDYDLTVSLKGLTASVSLNGQAIVGHGFHAVTVDGGFGLLTGAAMTSFDEVTFRTDDRAFEPENLLASAAPQMPLGEEQALSNEALRPIVDAAIALWTDALALDAATVNRLEAVTFQPIDLPDLTLGQTVGDTVYIDVDAAGYGWFIDTTPEDDAEFQGQAADGSLMALGDSDAYGLIDLLTVVTHELGHVLGFDHVDPTLDADDLMRATLDAGERRLLDEPETDATDAVTTDRVDTEAPVAAEDANTQDAAVLVFDDSSGSFQSGDDAPNAQPVTSYVLDRMAFGPFSTDAHDSDAASEPGAAVASSDGADDSEQAPSLSATAKASLIEWGRTFAAPLIWDDTSSPKNPQGIAQLPTFKTMPFDDDTPGSQRLDKEQAPDAQQPASDDYPTGVPFDAAEKGISR